MVSVLGISPGTRSIGLAVFSDNTLVHWQVKTFQKKWSEQKLKTILTALERITNRYVVSQIVCKIIHPSLKGEGLKYLLEAIDRFCYERHIVFVPCSLDDLLTVALPSGTVLSKELMADYLSLRYPELARELSYERVNRHPHYMKMFEAIAAVEFYKKKE